MKHVILSITIFSFYCVSISAQEQVDIQSGKAIVGHSPGQTAQDTVVFAIDSANSTIDGVIYEFTNKEILKAFVRAKMRGVSIRLVADYKAANEKYSLIPQLIRTGINVRLDSSHSITHHKFLVIDSISCEFGSFNWTSAAVKSNAEDCVYFINQPALSKALFNMFAECWNESK